MRLGDFHVTVFAEKTENFPCSCLTVCMSISFFLFFFLYVYFRQDFEVGVIFEGAASET